jgi:hypothetical protein
LGSLLATLQWHIAQWRELAFCPLIAISGNSLGDCPLPKAKRTSPLGQCLMTQTDNTPQISGKRSTRYKLPLESPAAEKPSSFIHAAS